MRHAQRSGRQVGRLILRWVLLGSMVAVLSSADIAAGAGQELPAGGGPIPPLRRGANGQIEVVPPAAAARTRPKASRIRTITAPKPDASTVAPAAPVADTVGTRYNLSADEMPAPNTTPPNYLAPYTFGRPTGLAPRSPKGFSVSIFAANVGDARWLAVAPNGDVFLAASGNGKIMMLRDEKAAGVATRITTFAAGFTLPHGLAFHDGALYVADVRAIWRYPYRDGDEIARGTPQRVTTARDLRIVGQHWTREIVFDSKGRLYLSIGARGDVLDDDPPPDATVQQVAADGTMTTFAAGLRNVVGMAVYPGTDQLWGTVNERDRLGGGLPPDYLARINKGDFFGWPYAYIGPHPDPVYGKERLDLVAKTRLPEVLFEPHSAPLGLVFYDGAQFPAEYRGDAFVAFHASGPYNRPDGYKVVRVKFANGMPVGGYEDFVTGFMLAGINPPHVWGTPAGLAVTKDGSLLIADEEAIWRVAYTGFNH
jgi:glucose/arabinose dehydrogenase